MIDTALQALLVNVAGVGSRVTPGTETKPMARTLPRVVFTLINNQRTYTDAGVLSLQKATYQIDVFAKAGSEARATLARITARADRQSQPGLDGYNGTNDGTIIKRIYFGSEYLGLAANEPGQDQTDARATLDVLIDYQEPQ